MEQQAAAAAITEQLRQKLLNTCSSCYTEQLQHSYCAAAAAFTELKQRPLLNSCSTIIVQLLQPLLNCCNSHY
jgi:hypothetical protein